MGFAGRHRVGHKVGHLVFFGPKLSFEDARVISSVGRTTRVDSLSLQHYPSVDGTLHSNKRLCQTVVPKTIMIQKATFREANFTGLGAGLHETGAK